jgi:probable rRNA maturation factor
MITIEPPRELADGLDAWRAVGLSRAGLSGFLRRAQAAVGLRGEVEVLLAGDRMLRRLNREFRGKNKATDVLSFPAMAEMAGVFAGDLAVSLETAGRQAKEHGHLLRDEVRVLLLHGLLHLSGMDHEVDGGEMAEREGVLRRELRLPSGLIARVEGKHTLGAEAPSSRRAMRPEAEASGYLKATAKADPYGMTTRKAKATAKADPYGMTTRKAKATAKADPYGMTTRKAKATAKAKASHAKGAKLNDKLREVKRERVATRKKVIA